MDGVFGPLQGCGAGLIIFAGMSAFDAMDPQFFPTLISGSFSNSWQFNCGIFKSPAYS